MMLRLQLRPARLPLKLSFTISFVVSFLVSCCADPPRHRPTRLAPRLPVCRLSPCTSSPSSQARAPLRGCCPRGGLADLCLPPVYLPSETTKPAASKMSYWRRRLPEVLLEGHDEGVAETNEMVMWPPAPVMEVVRLAVDSGGVRSADRRARRGQTIWGRAWSRGFSGWSHCRPVWSEQERIQQPAWEWRHRAAWQKNECGGKHGKPGNSSGDCGRPCVLNLIFRYFVQSTTTRPIVGSASRVGL
jgi:hypothetical protein